MEIMFDDLTVEAQKRLLTEAGVSSPEDMHWDTIPVAVVEFREDGHELDEDDFTEDVYDYGYDEP
ncbi:MAG: hypothetical protein ACYS1A_14140 [Planctomycetota bacterium]|jgi:hypothetical protein